MNKDPTTDLLIGRHLRRAAVTYSYPLPPELAWGFFSPPNIPPPAGRETLQTNERAHPIDQSGAKTPFKLIFGYRLLPFIYFFIYLFIFFFLIYVIYFRNPNKQYLNNNNKKKISKSINVPTSLDHLN